ncbi:MAG: gliding motility lipoprotein GldH [Prevotellamassilia sp.]
MKPLFYLWGLLLLITACHRSPIAYEYQPTPTDGWEPGDTLHFTTDTLTESGTYQLHIGVRTATAISYPYHSLWLVIQQDWQRPSHQQTDTIECQLASRQGTDRPGVTLYQYGLPVHKFNGRRQLCPIRVHHIMRNDLLTGIADVGIKLEKVHQE